MPYVKCANCNKELYRQPSQLKNVDRSFCGKNCHSEWRKAHWVGENSPAYKGKIPQEFTCVQCGQVFFRRPSSVKANKNVFCSQACKHQWQRENKANQNLKKREIVKCNQCGKEIERTHSQIRETTFCSRDCFTKWKSEHWRGENSPFWRGGNEVISCDICGKPIERHKSEINKQKRHFCGHECFSVWKSQQKDKSAPRWNGGKIAVNCANCGKEIKRVRSEVENRSEYFFCNTKCASEWRSKKYVGENHPNWKGRIETECTYCGNPLKIERWRAKHTKKFFCNVNCHGKWQSQNLTGNNRYNWKGGKIPYYGPSWGFQRDATRKRDSYTCQHCGMTQEEHGQKLHVHHLKPFREFNYVINENENHIQANDLDNLITLCRWCHRKAEFGQIII